MKLLSKHNLFVGTNAERLASFATPPHEGADYLETDTGDSFTYVYGDWEPVGGGGGATTFLGLTDVIPASYVGAGGQMVIVDPGETGLSFTATVPAHDIVGASHTIAGAAFSVVGATALNTLGLITPTHNPGAAERLLKTNSSGELLIPVLYVSSIFSMNGATVYDGTLSSGSAGNFLKRVAGGGGIGTTLWAGITEADITDLSHVDPSAIHVNVAGEINGITEKATPVSGDWLVIEDSADTNNKKKIQVGNLPGGSGSSTFLGLTDVDEATYTGQAGYVVAVNYAETAVEFNTLLKFSASEVVFNDAGADVDFRVEGVGQANALFVQGSDGAVGIRTNSPSEALEINGNLQFSTAATISTAAGNLTFDAAGTGYQFGVTGNTTDRVFVDGLSTAFRRYSVNSSGYTFALSKSRGGAAANNNDQVALFEFDVMNTTPASTAIAYWQITAPNTTAGAETGRMSLQTVNSGVLGTMIDINGNIVNFGGDVGFSVTAPQGQLHGHDGTGGFLKWSNAAVAGTAVTVIPNGTGDILYDSFWMYTVRGSSGVTNSGSFGLTPGLGTTLYNVGGETLAFNIAADGSVTVQRTAGTLTYHVALWGIWL